MNFHFPLEFDRPAYLLLLGLLPVWWWFGRRALAGLGKWRGATAFAVRAVVWTLLVLACAEMQWVRTDDRLTVVYLLDRSLSIPEAHRRAMIDYANRATEGKRTSVDLVGAVAFGRRAEVEFPPYAADLRLPPSLETTVDPQFSNLAEAFRLAEASFPADTARRIVIISDGNQNLENVYDVARQAAERGIGIDVVPVTYQARGEIWVEKVSLPAVARRGEPFDVQILVNNTATPGSAEGKPADAGVAGTLELVRRRGDETAVLSRDHVVLPPGKRPFAIRQTLEDPDFYVYEARFLPDNPRDDAQSQNNRAVNFTQLAGSGRILFIENFEKQGKHQRLVDALRKEKLTVDVVPSTRLFNSAAELIAYDTVVLADVPRTGGEGPGIAAFSDDQIKLLSTNVREMGCGIVMLGGPDSFGAGGWAGTPLEEAMPVDFQLKNLEVIPSGALMLVLDSSGSMGGEKIEMCKDAATAAIRAMGQRDYAGVVSFDSEPHWILPMMQLAKAGDVTSRIRRLDAGGGTNMEPALKQAYEQIDRVPAAVKHVIALTDGQTFGSGFEKMAADMKKKGVTTSCVAIGTDAAIPLLDGIAQAGGGKSYQVTNPRAIPRIFVKEARRVARPLIFEDKEGFTPQLVSRSHEITRGLTPPPSPLTGFVMTGTKASSLVQTLLVDPRFSKEGTGTIAAAWTYGLGRTAVWTTDCGQVWATQWNGRGDFDAFLTGLVRWTMRPPTGSDRFTVRADVDDGRGRIIVTGVDEHGDFINLLDPQGSVIGPDVTPKPLRLEQTAPGRYAATFDADDIGSYFVVVRPGPGQPLLRTGVNVAYSNEFRDRSANETLLASLAALKPDAGPSGSLAPPLTTDVATSPPTVDFFRHDLPHASGRRDLWPELCLAAVALFVGDVFLRRVAFEWRWLVMPIAALWARLRPNRALIVAPQYLERLRGRKDEIAQRLEKKAASGGEAESRRREIPEPPKVVAASELLPEVLEIEPTPAAPKPPPLPEKSPDDYTSRLLKAKRKVWDDRNK